MTLKSVMLQLDVDQIEQLDRQASASGVSRSHLVRQAVAALLHPPSDQSVADRYAQAYPDQSLGTDEWGDLDAWHAAAAASRTTDDRDPWA
ncbi:MAG TPA: CopG family transcriptional regulator [Ilumatobacter sp.]|nr:CopG family transcriptional regulator [Ilumatobacter sp.]